MDSVKAAIFLLSAGKANITACRADDKPFYHSTTCGYIEAAAVYAADSIDGILSVNHPPVFVDADILVEARAITMGWHGGHYRQALRKH